MSEMDQEQSVNPVKEEAAVPVEESIAFDVADDMYCGSLPTDVISDYTCMLCYGIVQKPLKCTKCDTMYCKGCMAKCMDQGKLAKGQLQCHKKCGSRTFSNLNSLEYKILNSLVFRCANDECLERVPLGKYRQHLKHDCKVTRYTHIEEPVSNTMPAAKKQVNAYRDLAAEDLEMLYPLEPE